jgi:hypothetical protein
MHISPTSNLNTVFNGPAGPTPAPKTPPSSTTADTLNLSPAAQSKLKDADGDGDGH